MPEQDSLEKIDRQIDELARKISANQLRLDQGNLIDKVRKSIRITIGEDSKNLIDLRNKRNSACVPQ